MTSRRVRAWKVYRVGYRHNDAYTAYVRMGAPTQLTRTEVTELQREGSGRAEQHRVIQVKADGSFHVELPKDQNDVVLVELTPSRS